MNSDSGSLSKLCGRSRTINLDRVRREADTFLAKYNQAGRVPVPIDEFAEFDMSLSIRPFGDLRKKFGRRGIVFSKKRLIVIDSKEMDDDLHGYRFTLAHEIGHLILHGDFIDTLDDSTEAALLTDLANADTHEASKMEREASSFAGRILVPTDALILAVDVMRKEILVKAKLDIADLKDEAHSVIAQTLSHKFDVAPEVVRRRLVEEGLP
jgi:hypothetical protein